MPTTIPDIVLSDSEWTDIYLESTITDGTAITIQNKSPVYLLVQENTEQPAPDNRDGVVASDLTDPWARVDVASGSEKIWAKVAAPQGRTARVNVQEVV